MTVAELIAALQQLDPTLIVTTDFDGLNIARVREGAVLQLDRTGEE